MLAPLHMNGLNLWRDPGSVGPGGSSKQWFAYGRKRFFGTRDEFEDILRALLRETEDKIEVLEEKRTVALTKAQKKPTKVIAKEVTKIENQIKDVERQHTAIIRRAAKLEIPVISLKANAIFDKLERKKKQRREDDLILILYALNKLH
jgi:galactokinase/mevalonate kinase-like predicted kinase